MNKYEYRIRNNVEIKDMYQKPNIVVTIRKNMTKSQITYILSTIWHSSKKKNNRKTKIKMGGLGDEKCEGN